MSKVSVKELEAFAKEIGTKVCRTCKVSKPVADFYGHCCDCKVCYKLLPRYHRDTRLIKLNYWARQKGYLEELSKSDFLTLMSRAPEGCYYCRQPFSNKKGKGITCDHKTVASDGGTNTLDNLVLACRSCNAKKQRANAEQYLATLLKEALAKLAQVFLPYPQFGS